MATRYVLECPNQSYAISREMCLARQLRNDHRCPRCTHRSADGEQVQAQKIAA